MFATVKTADVFSNVFHILHLSKKKKNTEFFHKLWSERSLWLMMQADVTAVRLAI